MDKAWSQQPGVKNRQRHYCSAAKKSKQHLLDAPQDNRNLCFSWPFRLQRLKIRPVDHRSCAVGSDDKVSVDSEARSRPHAAQHSAAEAQPQPEAACQNKLRLGQRPGTCMHVCAYIYIYIHMYPYLHINMYICVCIHICVCVHECVRLCACVYMYICKYMCVCMYIYIYVSIRIGRGRGGVRGRRRGGGIGRGTGKGIGIGTVQVEVKV